jgi:tetratricopeptide (TPR) repeat protein
MARWRQEPSLVSAAELVEAAIVEGKGGAAVYAARRLLTVDRNATPSIKMQAARLLAREGHIGEVPEPLRAAGAPNLATWRDRTRLHPRDPIAWMELALAQTIHRQTHRALRSLLVAVQLAPDNRYVLRSAARFFLHINEPERAHDLVAKSQATKSDPWLIATEISLAELAARQPRYFKLGVNFVERGGVYPRQITELAGALATLDLVGGNRRRAKAHFRKSLIAPTGNSLAQAEWATPLFGEHLADVRLETVPDPFEAAAFRGYADGRHDLVVPACELWASVEPYSIRPFEFASASAGLTGDFAKAEQMANIGLEIRPGSGVLVNSLAFALASMNRLDEAERALGKIRIVDENSLTPLIADANRALIMVRRGDVDRGMNEYHRVIDTFRRNGSKESEVFARIYMAREARFAAYPEAGKLQCEAEQAWKKFSPDRGHPALTEEPFTHVAGSKATSETGAGFPGQVSVRR